MTIEGTEYQSPYPDPHENASNHLGCGLIRQRLLMPMLGCLI